MFNIFNYEKGYSNYYLDKKTTKLSFQILIIQKGNRVLVLLATDPQESIWSLSATMSES